MDISQENIEELRTEFISTGGLVTKLPEVSTVRDFTIVGIPSKDSGGEKVIALWMMMDGEWYSLNSYRLTPTGASGSISQYDTTSEVIIANINEDTEIISTNIVGGTDDWTNTHLDNMGYSDGQFTIERPGKYFISWALSFSMAGAGNDNIEAGVMVNHANLQKGGWAQRRIGTASDIGSMSANGMREFTKGTVISLAFRNESGTDNIYIDHASLSILRIR